MFPANAGPPAWGRLEECSGSTGGALEGGHGGNEMKTEKRFGIGAFVLVLLALLVALVPIRATPLVLAQDPQPEAQQGTEGREGTGWVEGFVGDEKGRGIWGDVVVIRADGRKVAEASAYPPNSLYSLRGLPPGVYEVRISARKGGYKIQRFHGVLVKADARVLLNAKLPDGNGFVESGVPAVATQRIVLISQELERLQKEIDELKKK
jgi:hypothetical protein